MALWNVMNVSILVQVVDHGDGPLAHGFPRALLRGIPFSQEDTRALAEVLIPLLCLHRRGHTLGSLLGLFYPATARGFMALTPWYSALPGSLEHWSPKLWPGLGTAAIFGGRGSVSGDVGKAWQWEGWADS